MIYCPRCRRSSTGERTICPHCSARLPKRSEAPRQRPKGVDAKNKSTSAEKRAAGRLRLGEILLSAGLLRTADLEAALEKQREKRIRLGTILVQEELITESQLVQALSHQANIRWVDLWHMSVKPKMLDLIPLDVARKHSLFPLDARTMKDGREVLFLAMDDATDKTAIEAARKLTGMQVEPLYATPSSIAAAISIHEKEQPEVPAEPRPPTEKSRKQSTIKTIHVLADKKPAVRVVADSRAGAPEEQSPAGPKSVDREGSSGGGGVLTMLDGTVIPWAKMAQKGFKEATEEEELLAQLRRLPEDKASVAELKRIVITLVEALLRKKLIFAGELREHFEKNDAKG